MIHGAGEGGGRGEITVGVQRKNTERVGYWGGRGGKKRKKIKKKKKVAFSGSEGNPL